MPVAAPIPTVILPGRLARARARARSWRQAK